MTNPVNDPLNEKIAKIDERIDTIARFVGQSAELQVQTQMRLDRLVETIESLATTTKEHHASINQRIDNLLAASKRQQQSIEGFREIALAQQKTAQNLINLEHSMQMKS